MQDLSADTKTKIGGFVQLNSEYPRERYKHRVNKPLGPSQRKTRFEEFSEDVQSLTPEHDVTKQLSR